MDGNGKTALNIAKEKGHFLVVSASLKGDLELVKLLLENGADVDEVNSIDSTPLNIAAQIGNLELVKLLLEKGANVNKSIEYRIKDKQEPPDTLNSPRSRTLQLSKKIETKQIEHC